MRYDFSSQKIEAAEEFPAWLLSFVRGVEHFGNLAKGAVRHVLCTEYDVGAGIGWHRDKAQFDEVFGLSLGSACKFRFRRRSGSGWERYTLDAQPRSLYMMSEESRRVWEHSISPVETPRYSITFRTMVER